MFFFAKEHFILMGIYGKHVHVFLKDRESIFLTQNIFKEEEYSCYTMEAVLYNVT